MLRHPPLLLLILILLSQILPQTNASGTCPVELPQGPTTVRIVGGDPAPDITASYTASLINALFSRCTASLLSPFWALTASHCLPTNATFLFATSPRLGQGPVLRIARTIPFNPQDSSNADDIALIQLRDRAPPNATFLLVNSVPTLPIVGEFIRSVGFGRTIFAGGTDGVLRQVDVPTVSNEECNAKHASRSGGLGLNHFLCAGYDEGRCGSCQGDSGGPVVMFRNGRPVLVGVVSRGVGCAWKDLPGIYTRVSAYVEWMKRVGAVFNESGADAGGGVQQVGAGGATAGGLPAWAIAIVACAGAGVLLVGVAGVLVRRRGRGEGAGEQDGDEGVQVDVEADVERGVGVDGDGEQQVDVVGDDVLVGRVG